MRIRYCMSMIGKVTPCDVGWCNISYRDTLPVMTACSDDPMEKNCNRIIEIDEIRSYDDMSKTGYEGQESLISGGE